MNNEFSESTSYQNVSRSPIQSYTGAKISQREVENRLANADNDLALYKKELDEIAAKWKEIAESRKLSVSEQRQYDNLLNTSKQIDEFSKNKNKDVLEYIRLTNLAAQQEVNNEKKIREIKIKTGQMTKKEIKENLDYISELESRLSIVREDNRDLASNLDNSSKKLDYLSNSVSKLRSGLAQIAQVTGLNNVINELRGTGEGSYIGTRNQIVSSFGMTSNHEWESFKNKLLSNQINMNMDIGKVAFGFSDVRKYMSNLSQLGIYDTQMAEAQLQAVIEGNKLLGLSNETQAAILKIGKRSGNDTLLQEVNDTIATLLNAQIGISKQQLASMVDQATGSGDLLSYFGNDKAITQLTEAQAIMERQYGVGTSNAAMSILEDLLTNGVNSKYYTQLGGANDIITMAETDAGAALNMVLDKAKKSGMVATGSQNVYAASALGIDNNLITLYKAQYDNTVKSNNLLSRLENKTGEMAKYAENQWFPIEEQIGNIMSNIVAIIPFGEWINIDNLFYAASIAEFALNIARWKINNQLLASMALKQGILNDNLTDKANKLLSSGGSLATIAATVSIIAGTVMAIKDFAAGWSNPEEYNNKDTFGGKLKSGIDSAIFGDAEGSSSNALKNAIKWGLVGGGVGALFGGIGALPGFLIGGIAGLLFGGITGSIGGNNGLTNATSKLFGVYKDENDAEAKGGPIGGTNIGGTSLAGGSWPWSVTSAFGEKRRYRNTKGEWKEDVHNGIDLSKAQAEGTPMGVNVSGIVSSKGTDRDGANYVIIQDALGYKHKYWHLQQPSPLTVGQKVNAGQFLGLMGSTGNVTGPHLHYGIQIPGGSSHVNPAPFITSSLFNPTMNAESEAEAETERINLDVQPIDQKLVSANTMQADKVSGKYNGMFGGPSETDRVVDSVNSGFSNLIDKLDELSKRQDNTEEMLRTITSSSSKAVYKY